MIQESSGWSSVANAEEIPSPALLLYPERVSQNLRRMIEIAGSVDRLRPHVKTHKLAEIVRLQMAQGIRKFKTATIAETEMAASCGAPDVLLAYPPVGPNVGRLIELKRRFPGTSFAAVADDAGAIQTLSDAFDQAGQKLRLLLDIDCGMHRTGVPAGELAVELYTMISQLPGLLPAGLHAYDGHIHDRDLAARTLRCQEAIAAVFELRTRLLGSGLDVPSMVVSGTPTFPIHARRADIECSPGTCLLWDAGYASKFPDLEFLPAAVVLTRVVSKPGVNQLCLDLGHKAVASENPPPRVQLLGLPDARPLAHSEEHLVVETALASDFPVGHCLYGVPWHICPTVALYSHAVVVENGRAQSRWEILARNRALTV